jgi:hypothetical protein
VAVNSAAGWLIPEASTICCLLFARKNLRIDRPASRSEISGGGRAPPGSRAARGRPAARRYRGGGQQQRNSTH